ncbi:hypothetical protein LEP1GSC188_4750 [Leptospira weilii serovar Topaz str. LT2116]|uniref:Uncharacterized protein n=1 Tax=Leptospira weilii serovar Topaz str. LT2116 TaxID=1088540 RepID=M3EMZ3_9LEPT|nr:hypothetical protein LEP1GSC188_4750 [Leptospira weilii serovar Topaz str. LT2116]
MFSIAITECVSKKIRLLGTLYGTYSSNRSAYKELTVNEDHTEKFTLDFRHDFVIR